MRPSLASVSDLLDCPTCGGLHAVPWCTRKPRRGDLPQTAFPLADMDGEPFAAYYCPTCAEKVTP
jgi:hypothetical protein